MSDDTLNCDLPTLATKMITQSSSARTTERQSRAYRQESSGGQGTDRTHHAACTLTHNQLWARIGLWVYLENRVSVLWSREVSRVDTVV